LNVLADNVDDVRRFPYPFYNIVRRAHTR
jgi:hypothetical protein